MEGARLGRPQRGGQRGHQDFSEEYLGREVKINLRDGAISGFIVGSSKYWFKVRAGDGRILYLNKAHVVSIEL